MNDTNTTCNGLTINGDIGRQTLNRGGSDPQTITHIWKQDANGGALAICQACDGTGWTHHATKGLTRCQGLGFPHGK